MPKFRKKPVVIEAFQMTAELMNDHTTWPVWLYAAKKMGRGHEGGLYFGIDDRMFIQTLEGEHAVNPGDYIIMGVAGEIYPCKPYIFKATYDPVLTHPEESL